MKQEFFNFISDRVNEHWAEKQEPLLLSSIPTLVTAGLGISYKDMTDGLSLKRFLLNEAQEGNVEVKVVYHPLIKALIGLIPKDQSYSFQQPALSSPAPGVAAPSSTGSAGSEQVVRDFLALVARLPTQDAQKVIIPMEVLTQLMFGK